ncbi:hypothetical protein [Niastella populi]|uniref:Uncharacterized protein n=1 Tax=Niastella populi TaxID=550983 RepID=A0A1V9F3E8_9BACT|nr:hypothetical protein [Niastella populi]OQP52909.1 hypothetical protein A4R26_28165 [Niastella populi]
MNHEQEYAEYVRKEEAERKEKTGKRKAWIILISLVVVVGTCNTLIRNHEKQKILTKPQIGDYFVFTFKKYDRPYKLKAIQGDSMEFFVPMYATSDFRDDKSESKVHELEKSGKMYTPLYTIYISTAEVEKLRNNEDATIVLDGEEAHLKTVYGKAR